jgi:hypothetical protein
VLEFCLTRNDSSRLPFKDMSHKFFSGSLSRNLFNLSLVFFVLLIITACVCRGDRDLISDTTPTPNEVLKKETPTDIPTKIVEKDKNRKEDKGDFIVEHVEINNPRYEEIDRQIKNEKLLEKAADQLNRALVLPHDIQMRTTNCGVINAFYNPQDKSITMCYEFMEYFYTLFRNSGASDQEAYDGMFDATRFFFLHEIGHALIDAYKLPVTANEEDAADRCSAFVCLHELGDEGVNAILSAADFFRLESQNNTERPSGSEMADEHLLQEQRFYNSLCMVYGSNPTKYGNIVTKGFLPEARAVRCPNEYQRTAESWSQLLAPWRKN